MRTVRKLTREEVAAKRDGLHGLLERALADSPLVQSADKHLEHARVDLDRAATYDAYRTFVAEDSAGRFEGFAFGTVGSTAQLPAEVHQGHPGFASGALLLLWVAVDPPRRRRRVAYRLLDAVEAAPLSGQAWGFVNPANTPARRLYDRRGWRLLGIDRGDLVLGYSPTAARDIDIPHQPVTCGET